MNNIQVLLDADLRVIQGEFSLLNKVFQNMNFWQVKELFDCVNEEEYALEDLKTMLPND